MLTILFSITCALVGAAVGSFTSVIIYRLHSGKKGIFRGRSKCPECEVTLQPLDLIPVVSFLTLRGKCRYCSKAISYMYPLLELLTGTLFLVLFFKFPFLSETLHFSGSLFGLYLLSAFYTFVLIFTFFFDLRYLQVADEILLPGILIALIATIAYPMTPHFLSALIGMAIATVFFGLQIIISKGKWLGLGDIRVGAFMGAVLGWKLLLVALFSAYIIGSLASLFIAAQKKQFFGIKIPFAPFLVLGTFVAMFFGEEIMEWYLRGLGF